MTEIVERLPPTPNTLRELYLKSGNRCAFPGCNEALFNATGNFVAQVCHIEAAMPGGERFNANQTNEQRRQFSNLVLLCYVHHVETNDTGMFKVDRMQRIKADHELLFSDVVGKLSDSVKDQTKLLTSVFPTNLRRLNQILGWNHSDSELSAMLGELLPFLKRYANLPKPTREFLAILIDRGSRGEGRSDLDVAADEARQAAALTGDETRNYFGLLDRHGFTELNSDDSAANQIVAVCALPSGWTFWSDLKNFCEKRGTNPSIMLNGLDFGDFDSD